MRALLSVWYSVVVFRGTAFFLRCVGRGARVEKMTVKGDRHENATKTEEQPTWSIQKIKAGCEKYKSQKSG